MLPVYSAVFGISKDELKNQKFLGSLRKSRGELELLRDGIPMSEVKNGNKKGRGGKG